MNTLQKACTILFFSCTATCVSAQDSLKNKAAIAFFSALKTVYEQAPGLGFTVQYTYTDEQNPTQVIDTLSGTYCISGNKYWFKMAGTETLKNDSLVVMLFNDDKMMYVRKAPRLAGFDPMEQLQLFLSNNKTISSTLTKGKKYHELAITFPEGMDYKSVSLYTDKNTGFLTRSVFVMRTKLLTNNADELAPEAAAYSAYAKVEAVYANYHNDTATALFDEKKFIERRDSKLVTTTPFKDYKLFLGSPNL